MKNNYLILGLAIIVLASCSQKKPAELTNLGLWTDYYILPGTLNGRVKEMKELNYWAVDKNGKYEKGEILTQKDYSNLGSIPNLAVYFDPEGNVEKFDLLDGTKVIQSRIGTIKNGKLVRQDYKLNDSAFYYTNIEYDQQGKLLGARGYRPISDTLVNQLVFGYDEKGNINKYEYYNSNKIKTGYHLCTLDASGHIVEAKYFNHKDSLAGVSINTYNESGTWSKQVTETIKPKSTQIWEYKDLKFDNHKNLIAYFSSIDGGKHKLYTERIFIYY